MITTGGVSGRERRDALRRSHVPRLDQQPPVRGGRVTVLSNWAMSCRLDSLPPQSRRLLEGAAYQWAPETGVWINNRIGRAIGYETVRDHDVTWLKRWLQHGQD